MSSETRRATATAVAIGVTLAIAWLSQIPYAAEDSEAAIVRLSWRARGERVRECRRLSEEEQRQLPQHMRRQEVCEGRVSPYLLGVYIDGRPIARDTLAGSGARQDRPLYVYREIRVIPKPQKLVVSFSRLGDQVAGEADPNAVPPLLELAATIQPKAGDVILVTYDAAERRLVVREAPLGGSGP